MNTIEDCLAFHNICFPRLLEMFSFPSCSSQGINGILADEMGLGKTVQAIAFLAHVAERYGKTIHYFVIVTN